MSARHTRVPASDEEIFAEPPLETISRLIDPTFGGFNFRALQKKARREVLDLVGAGTDSPTWFVAGHEPEFFHPGVWLKNMALTRLANKHNAVGLNIIVDNDVPKSASVRVPVWRPKIAADDVTVAHVPFDSPALKDVPYEERTCHDVKLRSAFASRITELTKKWPFRITGLNVTVENAARIGDWIVAQRRAREAALGIDNLEVRVSQLAQTQAFSEFVELFLVNATEVYDRYNAAVRQFRQREGIRSRHHPVPELIQDGDWIESPFWCWSSDRPQRQRLFVRPRKGGQQIRWGGTATTWPDAAVKIRPRALTLTHFARFALADVFIHGIGGGKYEVLNDAIESSWEGVRLPPYVVLSGTLRLPLPHFSATDDDLHRSQRRARDLQWNPQRVIDAPQFAIVREQLLGLSTATRIERRNRARRLRENLEHWNRDELQRETHAEQLRIESELLANQVLSDRDYPWFLYPEEKLHRFMDSLRV